MDNIVDIRVLKERKELRDKVIALKKNIKELKELLNSLKAALNCLTKFQHYSTIKRRAEDLFSTYQDIKRAISTKEEMLRTLEIKEQHVE